MRSYLYENVQRVPSITDKQIAEMRHIEPVVKSSGVMWRRILGADKIDPRNVSCVWYQEPTGDEFSFDTLNTSTIITQHHSAVFFKPSLAEVYAWIRVYMPDTWGLVKYFHLRDQFRIGASSDFGCYCEIMGGDLLVRGHEVVFPSGAIGFELVKKV